MKYRILAILIICCMSTNIVWGQALDSLVNAQEAYENSDYEAAIQYFELTVNGGIYNAEILYNLGNAHFQNGDLGSALLNYQRAMLHKPRDLDLNIQIAKIRAIRTTLQIETTQPLILVEQVSSSIMTIAELSILTFLIWNITWITQIIRHLRNSWRQKLRLLLASLAITTAVLLSLLFVRIYVYHQMPSAIVLTDTVPTYTGPSISYFELYELSEASEIYVSEQRGGWYKYVTADNRQGWIESHHVALVPLN